MKNKILPLICLLIPLLVVATPSVASNSDTEFAAPAAADPFMPLRGAWQQGRQVGKGVMLVLGAEWCERCELLARYMSDQTLKTRIDQQFVVLELDVGSPDSMISLEAGEQRLPVIVVLDSAEEFDRLMQSDSLLTFLPEPYEPLYDWLENILLFTEDTLAAL